MNLFQFEYIMVGLCKLVNILHKVEGNQKAQGGGLNKFE